MANIYSPLEYAFIETEVDVKLEGKLPTCLILNFLGAGLCAWCEKEVIEVSSRFCNTCNQVFDSILYE